jgi:hypothetical protein
MDVVILDPAGAVVQEVATGPSTDSDPVWSPDGRYVLFASDRGGISNLYARDLSTGRLHQVTNVLTGAFQPDISPDGRWIVFSLYLSDGYHIARIPFDPSAWRDPPAPVAPVGIAAGSDGRGQADPPTLNPSGQYSPFRYLLPTYWSLVAGGDDLLVGAETAGRDLVDRHLWSAEAVVYPDDWRLQVDAAYRYRGWGNPVLDVAGGERWSLASEADSIPDLLRRDLDGSLAVSWSLRRWNQAASIQASFDVSDVHFRRRGADVAERDVPLDLGAGVGIGYSTVRSFSLSLGPQEGISTFARFQAGRYVDPPDWAPNSRDYWRITTRNRAYRAFDWFGFAPPTFALKLDGGVESTPVGSGFSLGGTGGSGGGSSLLPDIYSRMVGFPVRGYPVGAQRGTHIVTTSVDYRFPISLVERGFRVFPLAFDRLWGNLFIDGGSAWCPAGCGNLFGTVPDSPTPLVSIGGEAILRLRVGYSDDYSARFGVAVPLRDPDAGRPTAYVRLGSGL